MEEKALSADGYIIDQSVLKDMRYGIYPTSVNGCGWIAAYNILHDVGCSDDPDEIFRDVLSILPYQGSMGTPTATMLEYLRGWDLEAKLVRGKKNILAAEDETERGILRYRELLGDHYVAFTRVDPLRFRFFNAEEGNAEHLLPLEIFFERYIHFPGTKLIKVGI